MRSFRVGLIPVRLVAPLILAAVAVPIVIDLLKPGSEKLKEGLDNLKPKDQEKGSEPVNAQATEQEAPKAQAESARKPTTKRAPRKVTAKPAAAKTGLRKASARRPRKATAKPEPSPQPEPED